MLENSGFEVFMESDNTAKFRKIVESLPPEKRKEIYARLKGMSRDEAMVVVNRMVEISEQRKIEITARPKVLAGGARAPEAPRAPRTDYEVRNPRTWTGRKDADDNKIEIVRNPSANPSAKPSAKPSVKQDPRKDR